MKGLNLKDYILVVIAILLLILVVKLTKIQSDISNIASHSYYIDKAVSKDMLNH